MTLVGIAFLKPLCGVASAPALLGLFVFLLYEDLDEIKSELVEPLWRLAAAPSNLLTGMRELELVCLT